MGERLVLSTMTANQHLQRFMLIREFKAHDIESNFVELDDTIPNEAASDITLDNSTASSLDNLVSRGQQLATERFTQQESLRAFFKYPAKPFTKKSACFGV